MSTIMVAPNTIINSDTTYNGETLDFSAGNMIVRDNAVLKFLNCNINGVLSPSQLNIISVELGSLDMANCVVSISSGSIPAHSTTQSLAYVIRLEQAKVILDSNTFNNDFPFTVGFMITSVSIGTDNINISNNTFQNFHGALYLLNSANTNITYNLFKLCSYGNIVLVGNNSIIDNNKILFAGQDRLGNGLDILNSEGVTITNNVIFTPTCRGIFVVGSSNVVIDSNAITGGITYAIILTSVSPIINVDPISQDYTYALKMIDNLPPPDAAHNITVSNNVMSQNRYGLAATNVDILNVTGNYFSQRFDSAADRKFWTDNNNLFNNVTHLTWSNNQYKEAFTQMNGGDNSMTEFVSFPVVGGVVLP